ncbi:MAG: hypothetical protein ACHQHO_08140 [Solirubrobacterales bacterium]
MLSKTRITIVTLVASAGLAVAAVAPAVSQAQWHTYCVSGHCITHKNFTTGGGVNPCVGANENYNKAYEALLDAIQNKKDQADRVHPEMTQAEAQAQIEEAEGRVHLASVAAFEWGCDVAVHSSPGSLGTAHAGVLHGLSRAKAS